MLFYFSGTSVKFDSTLEWRETLLHDMRIAAAHEWNHGYATPPFTAAAILSVRCQSTWRVMCVGVVRQSGWSLM